MAGTAALRNPDVGHHGGRNTLVPFSTEPAVLPALLQPSAGGPMGPSALRRSEGASQCLGVPKENPVISEGVPELMATTESEQMYLITVARAAEEGASGPIPLAALASSLAVSVASANEMIRKLAGKALVEYVPYKGVELTEGGRRVAARVLRTRRLWATFLAEHLAFSAAEADALACNLEHVTPPDAAERLAGYLGNPPMGPLGNPIPPDPGSGEPTAVGPLTGLPVGGTGEIASAPVTGRARDFLTAEALTPGAVVLVRASGSSGILIEAGGHLIHLSTDLAGSIYVKKSHNRAGG